VWIDTDISIGSPFREVDDGYALMLALHSPEIRIAGISTSYGNANLSYVDKVARDFVQRFGGPFPPRNVFQGARSRRDFSRSAATDALATALKKEPLTYVAIAPLTNLATFLQLHPDLAKRRIKQIIFVGGEVNEIPAAFGPTRSFKIHDANVFKDPAAAQIVMQSGIPLVLIPPAIAGNLTMTPADVGELAVGEPAGRFLATRSRAWLWFWTHVVKSDGGPIFDAVAVAALTHPRLISSEVGYARITIIGNLAIEKVGGRHRRTVSCCTGFKRSLKPTVLRKLIESG